MTKKKEKEKEKERKKERKKKRKKEKNSRGNVVRRSKTELHAVLKLDNNVRQCAVKLSSKSRKKINNNKSNANSN